MATIITLQSRIRELEEEREEELKAAFVAGCEAVHNNYQEDRAPDFTEAGYDYAHSVRRAARVLEGR